MFSLDYGFFSPNFVLSHLFSEVIRVSILNRYQKQILLPRLALGQFVFPKDLISSLPVIRKEPSRI